MNPNELAGKDDVKEVKEEIKEEIKEVTEEIKEEIKEVTETVDELKTETEEVPEWTRKMQEIAAALELNLSNRIEANQRTTETMLAILAEIKTMLQPEAIPEPETVTVNEENPDGRKVAETRTAENPPSTPENLDGQKAAESTRKYQLI